MFPSHGGYKAAARRDVTRAWLMSCSGHDASLKLIGSPEQDGVPPRGLAQSEGVLSFLEPMPSPESARLLVVIHAPAFCAGDLPVTH